MLAEISESSETIETGDGSSSHRKGTKIAGFEYLDANVTLADQMQSDEAPIVLINVFTASPEDEGALLKA